MCTNSAQECTNCKDGNFLILSENTFFLLERIVFGSNNNMPYLYLVLSFVCQPHSMGHTFKIIKPLMHCHFKKNNWVKSEIASYWELIVELLNKLKIEALSHLWKETNWEKIFDYLQHVEAVQWVAILVVSNRNFLNNW